MILKLAGDEVQEVQRALLAAYAQLLRELSRVDGYLNRDAGLELCQRKWKLEALLRQLDHSEGPPPVLELVPAVTGTTGDSTRKPRIPLHPLPPAYLGVQSILART